MQKAALVALVLAACGGDPASTGTPNQGLDSFEIGECPAIYAQDRVPTFEMEIEPAEWDVMVTEYRTWEEREAEGLDLKPYHPLISFKADGQAAGGAMVRLRANPCCSWYQDKMQFQISFNENDSGGRFLGLRKIILDDPSYDPSLLHERLALSYLRDLGLTAPCANNARLLVNGQVYGLYTNIEKIDREFLERNFADPDGDLFKKAWELKTNEDTSDLSRAQEFLDATTIEKLERIVDLDEFLLEWAGEAILPDKDGFWGGGGNYYLYDDPTGKKLMLLPWDFDKSFDVLPADNDPITWIKPDSLGRPHVDAVYGDPVWRERYLDTLRSAIDAYDDAALQARVDEWAAQIGDAVAEDQMKSFTVEEHQAAVAELRGYLADRGDFLRAWMTSQ